MSTTSIIDYYKNNKDLEIVDIFKFIYQSVFGCEHLVLDYEKSLEFMLNEWENAAEDDLPDIEFLDGDFCRVHLKMMQDIDSLKKLCLYFVESSEAVSNGTDKLKEKIDLICRADWVVAETEV